MTDLKSTFNILKVYRYYRFGRYFYTFSSFIGFLFLLFNSPQRLAPLLKIAGLSYTTFFSRSRLKYIYDAIENTTIKSDPRGHNSIVVPYIGKMGQHKEGKQDDGKQDDGKQDDGKQDDGKQDDGKQDDGKQDDGKQDGSRINDKFQYAINNDTLMRWYCKYHGLRRLSLHICQWGGLLFLTYY
jgi:hypothetical protein